VTQDRLLERLRRLEQQIRAFKELHANELQIILDELSDIAGEVASTEKPMVQGADSTPDPAAASPKRAKWLAEQERKARPLSRRELLRGRDEES
jgi:hypothetical protein